ncbi:MAG: ArsR family transcriptional regulator [Candidatus Latescibacterota bacterium]|jgi:predicted transcriptional regulator|nr:MAG: ArsR family transcriptional regulator [Candidatus Latescibacterota bacterium]
MFEALFGSTNRERVLFFLHFRKEGYPREISRFFKTDLAPIQKQLEKLENGGALYSRNAGRTRLYGLNPRYPLVVELRALLEKAALFLPQADRERLVMARTRPRRKGKPL